MCIDSNLLQVWLEEMSFLRFRTENQHSQCSQCVKHKTVIKGLASHLLARAKQQEYYHMHLRSQYLDRCLYWEARSLSRLRGHTVTVIGDGMDQAKWEIPRSSIMKGKEFSTFQKARCHVACLHAHGRCCLYFVSAPDTKKDGNASKGTSWKRDVASYGRDVLISRFSRGQEFKILSLFHCHSGLWPVYTVSHCEITLTRSSIHRLNLS